MEGLFKNKYRPETLRLSDWDYSFEGFYFVTICAKGRRNYFGQVRKRIIGLNILGCVIWECWYELPKHYPNCILDGFIAMPNHIHGIIEINNKCRDAIYRVSKENNKSNRDAINRVSTGGITKNANPMLSNSLSAMVRWYKGHSSFEIHQLGYKNFQWQPRFYEHIIRIDTESLEKIRYYIKFNPAYWDKDKNNPVNF